MLFSSNRTFNKNGSRSGQLDKSWNKETQKARWPHFSFAQKEIRLHFSGVTSQKAHYILKIRLFWGVRLCRLTNSYERSESTALLQTVSTSSAPDRIETSSAPLTAPSISRNSSPLQRQISRRYSQEITVHSEQEAKNCNLKGCGSRSSHWNLI